MSKLNDEDELRQINSDLAWWREAFPRVLGFTFRIEATILTTGGGTMGVSGVFRDDIVAQLAAAREAALREALVKFAGVKLFGITDADRAAAQVQYLRCREVIHALLNNPGKEVMPDESSRPNASKPDTAPAGLSAGGGADLQPMCTAPRDGTFFLMYGKEGHPILVNWPEGYGRGIWKRDAHCWHGVSVSREGIGWMPLPAPPATEGSA